MKSTKTGPRSPFGSRQIGQKELETRFLSGCVLVSLGILLAAGGGSWDITNHLLNKPETFFSPPHAVLYIGAGTAVAGAVVMTLASRSIMRDTGTSKADHPLSLGGKLGLSVKMVVLGIVMLISAGPIDFGWHSAFGLDGLLSPPHFVLVMGMILSSLAALIGIVYCIDRSASSDSIAEEPPYGKKEVGTLFLIIGVLPVWLATSGLIHMFSLPFSQTPYFDFDPDPTFAVILATIGFSFLTSIILYCTWWLGGERFGILSIAGAAFLSTSVLTSMLPNESLLVTIPFYLINMIPIVVSDVLLAYFPSGISRYLAGAIMGSAFLMIYYPLIAHTYHEALTNLPLLPSLTASKYFDMISTTYPLVVAPAILMGITGIWAGRKLARYV